jgi:hypothetical protein
MDLDLGEVLIRDVLEGSGVGTGAVEGCLSHVNHVVACCGVLVVVELYAALSISVM